MAETERRMQDEAAAPPDYWPDVRRIPDEHVRSFPDLVRKARKTLGISNADIGKEVQRLIEAHNNVSGRTQVVSHAAWSDVSDADRCTQQLKSIRNGTRKYLVGYLAWLWLHDEDAARELYETVGLPFRPFPKDRTEPDDHSAIQEAGKKEQLYIYEAAFLWFGKAAPSIPDHHSAMTPEIAKMKSLLHSAVELGMLEAEQFNVPPAGLTRTIERNELRRFAEEAGSFPRFLFPGGEASVEDPADTLAKFESALAGRLQQHPKPVENWAAQYERNEWAIYEAAFLWHGFIPPPAQLHEHVMPETVQQTKQMLHDAANAGALMPSIDTGIRMRNVMVHGTRRVSRPELRQFATTIGHRPKFLFPKGDIHIR